MFMVLFTAPYDHGFKRFDSKEKAQAYFNEEKLKLDDVDQLYLLEVIDHAKA